MRILNSFLLIIPCLAFAQNDLTIDVEGVPNSEGSIMVALYDQSDAFLKMDRVYKTTGAHAHQGVTSLLLEDIPNGVYAVAVFHDENGNDELDTNWIGIPKETVGFSNAKMKTFGPPKFKECSFKLDQNKRIEVIL